MLQARPHAVHFKRILDFGEGQDGIENKFCGRDAHRADSGSGIAQGLRGHPILAVGAVQITAEHPEAVSQCPGMSMEEGFFLYRVALDAPT
jgi:hypothetical protein